MSYNQFVGWGEESTWGTPVTRTDFARPYEDSVLTHEKPHQPHEHIGSGRDPDYPFFQAERGVGNISIPLVYAGCEDLLAHCMGAAISTTGVGPYVHTLSLDDEVYTRTSNPHIGLTYELNLGLPDSSFEALLLYGGRVRSFGSNFRANEEIRLTMDLVGKRVVQAAKSGAPTFPDYGNASASPLVKFQQITLALDGTTVDVYGVEWNVNNNLRDDKVVLGSSYIAEPRSTGRREITGTIDWEWTTGTAKGKAMYDKFLAGTPAAILATATGPGNFAMTFRWNNVYFTGDTPGLTHGEEDDAQLPFTAYEDGTYGAFQIAITNDTAAP